MKPLRILMLLSALTTTVAMSQDISHQRAIYQDINATLDTDDKATATVEYEGTKITLTGWLRQGSLRKILAKPGIEGSGFDEYYLENGEPIFIYRSFPLEKTNAQVQERLYFENGRIVKWLADSGAMGTPHSEDYASMSAAFAQACPVFASALSQATATGAKTKTQAGTFLGIEQGDYAHWKMQTSSGEETSYFILDPSEAVEKILADPAKYQGRKCRISYKSDQLFIPEAGQKIHIDQLLSVEWQ